MKLQSLNCPNCGSPLRTEGQMQYCDSCGSSFKIDYDESDVEFERLSKADELNKQQFAHEKDMMETQFRLQEEARIKNEKRQKSEARRTQAANKFKALLSLVIFLVVFFALHLIPVWAYIASVIKRLAGYKNVEYVFTDKRIILRSGLIGMDIKSFYYPSITAVNVKVGVLDRMFKVGDIYLESGQINAVIDDIDNPYVYGSKIQEIINDMKSDMAFPNALRPEDNPGYNTKYTKK